MIQNISRSALIVVLCVLFMVGCASTRVNKLTTEERSSLKKLIFIPDIEDVGLHTPLLKYEGGSSFGAYRLGYAGSYTGTTVSIVGSCNEKMSESEYESRTAEAVKGVKDCLSTAYGDKTYAPGRFKSLMSELIAQNNPFHITFVSEAEQEQFWGLSNEEKAAFIKDRNADAALIMRAWHMAGLDAGWGYGSYGVAYTGLYAEINDYQSEEEIYFSGSIFTEKVPVGKEDFCKEFIGRFEQALDEHTQRLYNEIIGTE